MKDPAVRSVSYAARGLWMDMLSLMHESARRGYLQVNGKPVNAEQLARMTGGSTDEVSRLLQELEDSGVFSRTDDGTIFSRRMVREERKRKLCSEAGIKGGGNPTFKGHTKGAFKGATKPNPNPSSSSSSSDQNRINAPPDFTPRELAGQVLEQIGIMAAGRVRLIESLMAALNRKAGEPGWSLERATLHLIERGCAFKSWASTQQVTKSWENWFGDGDFDKPPELWREGKLNGARNGASNADRKSADISATTRRVFDPAVVLHGDDPKGVPDKDSRG